MKKPLKREKECKCICSDWAWKDGWNYSCDNWEQYLAWVVGELRQFRGEPLDSKIRMTEQLIKSIESGEGGGNG